MMTPTPERGRAAAYPAEYSTRSRIHWGAIIAGALIAVAIAFALNLLGLGIGLATINPATESDPFAGIGTGAVIWYIISTLLALFAGGYVAARMAGFPKKSTSALHGLLAWALFTFLSLYLLNSAVGMAFNVVGSTLSTVANTAGNAVAAVVPDNLGQRLNLELNTSNISLSDIRREAFQLLEDTNKEALDPENLQQTANSTAAAARRNANDVAQDPYAAGQEINQVIDRIAQRGEKVINAADEQALINVLTERTDMTEAEARSTVDNWGQQYEDAMATVDQKLQSLGNSAQEVGGDVAGGLSSVAIYGFLALFAGAAAAYFGGMTGRQLDLTLTGGESINVADVDR